MTLQTIMLDDGTLIGAAGHDGSEKAVTLSGNDIRRFVDTEKLRVVPERQKKEAAPAKTETASTVGSSPAPVASSGSSSTPAAPSSQPRSPSANKR
jgi:hypothetical protein